MSREFAVTAPEPWAAARLRMIPCRGVSTFHCARSPWSQGALADSCRCVDVVEGEAPASGRIATAKSACLLAIPRNELWLIEISVAPLAITVEFLRPPVSAAMSPARSPGFTSACTFPDFVTVRRVLHRAQDAGHNQKDGAVLFRFVNEDVAEASACAVGSHRQGRAQPDCRMEGQQTCSTNVAPVCLPLPSRAIRACQRDRSHSTSGFVANKPLEINQKPDQGPWRSRKSKPCTRVRIRYPA